MQVKSAHPSIVIFATCIVQRFTKNVGSTVYMAPEVYKENDQMLSYTNKVDVYRYDILYD